MHRPRMPSRESFGATTRSFDGKRNFRDACSCYLRMCAILIMNANVNSNLLPRSVVTPMLNDLKRSKEAEVQRLSFAILKNGLKFLTSIGPHIPVQQVCTLQGLSLRACEWLHCPHMWYALTTLSRDRHAVWTPECAAHHKKRAREKRFWICASVYRTVAGAQRRGHRCRGYDFYCRLAWLRFNKIVCLNLHFWISICPKIQL